MGFSPTIKQKALKSAARHCCVCHRYKGVKMEVHHIKQEADGGPNTFDNAIPLCFDCHADAGHFNIRHPKGAKYSIPELKQSRDNWYAKVDKGTITEKLLISEHIQTNYYVLHSLDILERTLESDFSSVNKFRKKTYLSNNAVSKYWKKLLKSHKEDYDYNIEQNIVIEFRQFSTAEEYQSTYDNVVLLDKSGIDYPYYEAKREVNWSDLIDNVIPNSFISQLSLSGISAKDCCISLLHKNGDSCAGETPDHGYTEFIEISPLSFVFLGITNASKDTIKLNNLIVENGSFNLPNFNILPYEMVLVPIATAFKLTGIEDNGLCIEHQDGDRGEDFSRVLDVLDFNAKDVIYLNGSLKPKAIIYNDNSGEYETDIHELDFNNLYTINSYWQCGSCPHLFFITEDAKQVYSREILQSSSNSKGTDFFHIPNKVSKIIIRELEEEITYIDKIIINNKLSYKNIILHKGQSFTMDVKPFDEIKVKGSYSPIYMAGQKLNDAWLRNELVRKSNYTYNVCN